MFAAFNKFFSALTYLFSAAEKGAKSLDIVADVSVDTATAWRQERREEAAKLIDNDQ